MTGWIVAAVAAALLPPAAGTARGAGARAREAPVLLASAVPPGAPPPAPFVGNKGSRKIHRADCVWGMKISPGKRKYFATYQEALAEGYVPCSTCKPELAAGLPEPTRPPVRDDELCASAVQKFFHRGGCAWARKISAEHLVKYTTRDEALSAGKTPCPVCRP